MIRVRINEGKVGIVTRNGDYKRTLTEGAHWVSLYDKVTTYNKKYRFQPAIELNILLKDKSLAGLLEVVDVQENEIVIRYEDGLFQEVLTAGRYAYWKGLVKHAFIKADISQIEIGEDIPTYLLQRAEMLPYIRAYVVESYEKGLLYIDGKAVKQLDAGVYYYWKNNVSIVVQKTDLRQQRVEISGQEILTKDKAALRVNLETLYKVVDVDKALIENRDYEKQLYVVLQLAVREYIGTKTLDELLESKEVMNAAILKATKDKAMALGVEIKDCGIKDIILPGEVKEIMNQVLIAQKQAQANVISRREETASARSMLNTAKLMEENPMLLKLKEMEYVEKIAERINNISLSGGNQVIDQLREIFVKQ